MNRINFISKLSIIGVVCMAAMSHSQQFQIQTSGITINPNGADYPFMFSGEYDPILAPNVEGYFGIVGTYYKPLWWANFYGGNFEEIYYRDLYSVSDERQKENITDLGSVFEKIKNIRTVKFDYKPLKTTNERVNKIADNKNKIGFLAQDLMEQFPEMVKKVNNTGKYKESDTGTYYVNYTEMIPVLLKAVQELKEIVDKQQQAIAKLSKEN